MSDEHGVHAAGYRQSITCITLPKEAGAVAPVNIISDKFSGQSRGFGFVEMGSPADAQTAIERFNGYELQGRALTVNEAKPQAPRGGGRGGSDRGGRERSR
jgi:RNA recognition motif-containing protein